MKHSEYTTISGDTWDIVAFKTLGDEMYTDRFIKLNLAYRDTVIFPAGVRLVIPERVPEVSAKLPPWKRARS